MFSAPVLARRLAGGAALVGVACAHRGRAADAPAGVPVAWPAGACAAPAGDAADADRDRLDDRCELALARAFAPLLRVDRRDCLWDQVRARLAGGYLFAAQPLAGARAGGVRLAYLPAYYRDCGWSGPVCRLKAAGCGAHAGDSELILVDVVPAEGGRWAAAGVFLSAHCFGRSAGRCRWYRGAALAGFRWADGHPRGAPEVWVARGKHAHYPSRGGCDRGHWGYDSCEPGAAAVRFPVYAASQNVGSAAAPAPAAGGCLAAEQLPLGRAGTDPGTTECVWDRARPFRGWQAAHTGPAPSAYARYLDAVAGF